MPRIYTVNFENVTISAAQDLVVIKGSTGKICRILRMWLGPTNTTLQTAQHWRLRSRFLPVTVTLGSGGTTPTPQPLDPGDAAAAATAHVNDTTPATTNGTASLLWADGGHNYAGVDWPFRNPPIVGLNQAFTFELLSTVSGTCAFSGGVEFEESGL